MSAPKKIHELVEAFRKDETTYIRKEYSEARVRAEFINPFLKALGWHPGENPEYIEEWKDCIVETPLEVEQEAHQKRADYTCRIGKTPVLVIEAKKPQVALFDTPEIALQIRRYAYSLKLPIGVLTNFQQLAFYDGRIKPKPGDKANVARFPETLRYEEYVEKWDLIERLLSKEAILRGAQRDHIQKRVAKGLIPVDQAILAEIERWREELAQTMARKNKQLTAEELDFAVGRTIDRILFLRVSEARGIEPDRQLLNLGKGADVYSRLRKLFLQADERYNSGLFYFQSEKERSEKPDALTLTLEIEDKPLRQIIEGLYYPQNLYEYSLIPVEILGQVYEQFLGKQIVLKARHVADVVDKPEVRKAGGVYYTPSYIVDYIVEHTVGKLLEGKNPKQIETLRIVDPACGSGSFLLGAYQYLLDWYLTWYKRDGVKKHQREVCEDIQEGYRLTLRERKRILLAHIFGVDIDAQAVEVTKLSLVLKVLEGETQESVQTSLKFRERLLPDLGKNIQCGNSLIGTDFYKEHAELSDEERKKINPFDWKKAFPAVFKDGGFDAVIGNPPYGAEFPQKTLDYLNRVFETHVWRGESYLLFVERATELLREGGLFGYIIPDTYLNLGFTQSLRSVLLQKTKLCEIVVLPSRVFAEATVDTTLLFFKKARKIENFHSSDVVVKVFNKKRMIEEIKHPQREFTANTELWFRQQAFNVSSDQGEQAILSRAESSGRRISDIALMFYGIKTYQVGKGNPPQTARIRDSKPFTSAKRENRSFLPFYDGKHIGRYELLWKRNNWVKYGEWLAEPRSPEKYKGEKILVRKIVGHTLLATYIPETSYCNTLLFVLKIKPEANIHYCFLLGILNSTFIGWYYRKKFQISRDDTFPQIMIRDILQFPVPKFSKTRHDKMVRLALRMLKLHKDAQEEWVGTKQEAIEREIRATDEEIDRLVYELYGLTEEEIRIVEGEK